MFSMTRVLIGVAVHIVYLLAVVFFFADNTALYLVLLAAGIAVFLL